MFHTILIRKWEKHKFSKDWRKLKKVATVVTERPRNAFSGIIKNISFSLELISIHKLLDTIESSSIIKNFISDSLFLKAVLDLSFKPTNFIPGLIPRPEWMVVPPIFTTDIPVGPSKRILGFSGSLQ